MFGKENIPKENGYIFYPNHQGMFDGVAMLEVCEVPFSPVIKQELTTVPVVKQIVTCLESMPIDREDVRKSMEVIREVTRRIKEKENCLIFPEGTRSRQGNHLLPFTAGCFKAAVKAECSIVPVALIDSYKPFDEKGTAQVTVQVHILPPIPYEEYRELSTSQIAETVRQRIERVVVLSENYLN